MLKNFTLVHTPDGVSVALQKIDRSPLIAIDLETTGLDFMTNEIHGIAIANESSEFYFTHDAVQSCLSHLNRFSMNKQMVAHNGLFDLHFLRKHRVDFPIVDTMVAQFLVDENQRLGLKELAHTKLGIKEPLPDFNDLRHWAKRVLGKAKLEDVTIFDIPIGILAEYAARDTRLTYDLWLKTQTELKQEEMEQQFFSVEMPFLRLLLDMEEAGFFIDEPKLHKTNQDFIEIRDNALERFLTITEGVNPNSGKQLGEYLFGRMKYPVQGYTEKGAPSTDIVALSRLLPKDKNGAVTALLEYRKYDKLIGTYTEPFIAQLVNGRLYGNFNQTGTVTGRLSSSGPNLQNIPAGGETGAQVRDFFSVPPGYTFLDIDYSQLELRILAHYTRDVNMLNIFFNNGDPHQTTVDLLTSFGYTIHRRDAKTVNFGWAYGVGPRGLCDQIEKASGMRPKEEDAKAWLRGFEKAYPGAPTWRWKVIEYARDLGYVRTIAGRRRRLPDITSSDKSLSRAAERQAVNSIIQGSASDIIKHAMLEIYPQLPSYDAKFLAQVHDEICVEVPEDVAKELGDMAARTMIAAGEYYQMRVPLVAEPGYGTSWANAKH